MAMRLRWLLAVLLMLPGTALARQTGPTNPYRYCSVSEGGLSVVRPVRRSDGRVIFQSSLGNRLLGPREREFDAYFAWPGALSDAPLLWISADWITFISDGSTAIVIGGNNDRDETIVRRADRGDVTLFEVDPEALLRRFAGRREVKLILRSRAGTRLRAAATIDLAALRRELDAVNALAARFAGEPGTCTDTSTLRKEADPAQYACHINENGPPSWFGADAWRFTWQYRLSPDTYLDASRNIGGQERADEVAFLAQMRRGFGEGGTPYILLRVRSDSRIYRRTDLTATFTGSGGTLSYTLVDGVRIEWAALRGLGTGPITFSVRDPAGAAIEQVTIPAGFFDQVDARVATLAARLIEMRDSPMTRCEPENDIVVT